MDNSLLLSHLPMRLSHARALKFVQDRDEPPGAVEIAEALRTKGLTTPEAWQLVDDARRKAEETATLLQKLKIYAVNYWSIHYPKNLRCIDYPPWNLFFLGRLPVQVPTLAVVGTRRPNRYGQEVVTKIIRDMKMRPLQIVSGLAYGIDSEAHLHSCEVGIPNFAVLGCGLDVIYPRDHEELAARILEEGGGLLSEYPPGVPPVAPNFPWRNRIISGLADVVWIVQAGGKSGTWHTVRHALAQQRAIATTPGDIFSALSELPHKLLLDGAHPITDSAGLELLLAGGGPATVTH